MEVEGLRSGQRVLGSYFEKKGKKGEKKRRDGFQNVFWVLILGQKCVCKCN